MSISPNSRDGQGVPPNPSTVILMLQTIGDTTWRIFTPIVGLMVAGFFADRTWHTRPGLMIAGTIMGIIIAIALVRSQIKGLHKK